jgi:predicted transcriptional regulator
MTNISLTSQKAVQYVRDTYGYTSQYSVAKELSKGEINVQPIQISNYEKGRRAMSEKVAEHFHTVFGITITDAHRSKGRPSEWE